MTFGRYDVGYELALAEGLSNLKKAAEAAGGGQPSEEPQE
jgi:hypothetical protein